MGISPRIQTSLQTGSPCGDTGSGKSVEFLLKKNREETWCLMIGQPKPLWKRTQDGAKSYLAYFLSEWSLRDFFMACFIEFILYYFTNKQCILVLILAWNGKRFLLKMLCCIIYELLSFILLLKLNLTSSSYSASHIHVYVYNEVRW